MSMRRAKNHLPTCSVDAMLRRIGTSRRLAYCFYCFLVRRPLVSSARVGGGIFQCFWTWYLGYIREENELQAFCD